MNLIKTHITRIVNQDFVIKYQPKKLKSLPQLKKVSCSTKFPKNSKKAKAALTLIEVVSSQKAYKCQSRINSLDLNLRKKDLVGCKVVLRKKAALDFMQSFIFEVLPLLKNQINFTKTSKTLELQITDIFMMEPVETIYNYFQDIKNLDLVFEINEKNLNFFNACKIVNNKQN